MKITYWMRDESKEDGMGGEGSGKGGQREEG